MQAESAIVIFDDLTCTIDAQLMDRSIQPVHGETVAEWLDVAGNPTDQPPVMWEQGVRREAVSAVSHPNFPDEFDELVEYRIYRDGVLIGTSDNAAFNDQLPAYGTYEYRITAVYDPEGESIPSVAEIVNWNAITYSIEGVNTVIPANGGTITYDAQLFSELPQSFPGVSYRTYVTLPSGQVMGPLFAYGFTLAPFISITRTGLSQTIPAAAPPGDYIFSGRLWYQGSPVLEQTFDFDKMGP